MLSKTHLSLVGNYDKEWKPYDEVYYSYDFLPYGNLIDVSLLDPESNNYLIRNIRDYLYNTYGVNLKDCYTVYKLFSDRLMERDKKLF